MSEQLNNQKLIEQCYRIKELIAKTALTESGQKMYGVERHEYKLMPPVPIEEVRAYEKEHNIVLPVEYVYFITLVGRGGAGPVHGLESFPEVLGDIEELRLVSEQLSYKMTDDEWHEKYGHICELPDDAYICRDVGTITLTAMDTIFLAHLIVTGPQAGQVVYFDWEEGCPPIWPKSCSNFLDWYENWFSEILAGYKVHSGDFMFNEMGAERDLVESFFNHEDEKYRKEVLWSFLKFHSLSSETIEFLLGARIHYKKVVDKIFEKFNLIESDTRAMSKKVFRMI